MRASLQAMSLVNSKERVQGFGIFRTQMCARQVVGTAAPSHRRVQRHPGERGQVSQMLWRVRGVMGRKVPDGLGGQMGWVASPIPHS